MSSVDDLKVEVAGLSADLAGVAAKADAEIARVEAVIAALTATGSPDPAIAQAVLDLQAVRSGLSGLGTKLDAERA